MNSGQPPVPGDLTAPSPAPTTTWPSSSVFGHPPFTPSGHPYMTPRAAPLLSPAEPPVPSPAGPSPSPGGGVSFSPYGHGVSPAGGIMSGSSMGEASGLRSYGNGSGSGILGVPPPAVSPAGSVVTSPATSKLYITSDCTPISRRCSLASATEEPEATVDGVDGVDDGYLLMGLSAMEREDEEDEPLDAPPPATGRGASGGAARAAAGEMDVEEASGIGASSSLAVPARDVSAVVDEFVHEGHNDDDDGRGAERLDVNSGALTPSSKFPSTVPTGLLARVPTELPASLQTELPPSLPNDFPTALPPAPPAEYGGAHLEERRRAAPRLFELANEPLAGAQNGSAGESTYRLQWSELVIYDYEVRGRVSACVACAAFEPRSVGGVLGMVRFYEDECSYAIMVLSSCLRLPSSRRSRRTRPGAAEDR